MPLIIFAGVMVFGANPINEKNYEVSSPQAEINNQLKTSCVQTFDNIIVPISMGELKPSQLASEKWREFEVQKCATNHTQWEKSSIYYQGEINWERLIQEEEKRLKSIMENKK